MQTSEQIADLAAALSAAQGEIEAATKDRVNPAFKAKYADLTSVWDACRPALKKNGLAVLQEVGSNADGVSVATRIVHKSGQWIELGPMFVPATKKDAQGYGSAVTYAKRYSLAAALGIVADDDDDANAASGRNTNTHAPAKAAAPANDTPEFITPDQEKHIAELIQETKADMKKFLDYLKVRAIYEIPASQYVQAVNALEAKRKQAAE